MNIFLNILSENKKFHFQRNKNILGSNRKILGRFSLICLYPYKKLPISLNLFLVNQLLLFLNSMHLFQILLYIELNFPAIFFLLLKLEKFFISRIYVSWKLHDFIKIISNEFKVWFSSCVPWNLINEELYLWTYWKEVCSFNNLVIPT